MNQKINENPKDRSALNKRLLNNRGSIGYPNIPESFTPCHLTQEDQENLSVLFQLRFRNPKNNSFSQNREFLPCNFFVLPVSNETELFNSQTIMYNNNNIKNINTTQTKSVTSSINRVRQTYN